MLFLQVCEKHFRTLCQTYFHLKNKGDHSVIFFRLLIITITTRTHNLFRLVRPRKTSPGSEESLLFPRYLFGIKRIREEYGQMDLLYRKMCSGSLIIIQKLLETWCISSEREHNVQQQMAFFIYFPKLFNALNKS